jgi:anti-sigma B factor antagonist
MNIDISVRWIGTNAALVRLRGEFDALNAPSVKKTLNELIKRGRQNLMINLEEVTLIDASGLGTLIGELKYAKSREGALLLICTNSQIIDVFTSTGLVEVFRFYHDEETALHAWDNVA